MAVSRIKKASEPKKDFMDFEEDVENQPTFSKSPSKVAHITPENVIGALNSAVAGINSVFQLRDQLQAEVNVLKGELSIGNDVRIESGRLLALKREQEDFLYEFETRKSRLERELKETEEECKNRLKDEEKDHSNKLAALSEEQKVQLKSEVNIHILKLKQEREDHERKIRLEREDVQREQAHRAKFEIMLKDSREQNEKLSEQLTTLSREALSSASTSSMASKLKDIVAQMSGGGSVRAS